MIITTQPNQPIIDKEIKESKDRRVSRGESTAQGAKPIFNRQDLEAEKLSLIEQKLGELTNKLLAGLKAGEQGPNTPKALQVAPNLASDIKDLIKQLDGDEKLKPFKESLEKFIKPIEHMKAGDVAKSLQNSGIMLEAKIKEALEPQTLPPKIKELLSLMKNTSSASLKEGFLQLPNDSDAKKSIDDLTKLLNAHKMQNQKVIDNSAYKGLFKASASLENAVKYLDKLSNLNKAISPQNAQKMLARIENNINAALKTVNSYNLNSQSMANARNIKEQINQSANELKAALNDLKTANPNYKENLARNVKNSQNDAQVAQKNVQANEAPKIRLNMSNTQNTQNLNSAPKSAFTQNVAVNQPNAGANQANQATNQAPNQPNTAANQTSNQANQTANQAQNSAQNQATNQPNQAQNLSQNSTQNMQTQNAQNANFNQNIFSQNIFNQNAQVMPSEFKNINMLQFKEAISSDANGVNLQGKINELAKGIASLQSSLNADGVSAKHNLDEIKALQRAALKAGKQIGQISDNNNTEAMKSLQNDLKSVLLNLKESSANQNSMQNINQAVNRMLTQIEIHQLASFSQNALQTYLPYTWDELDSSHVSFKRGNKDKFYARIELNFVKYGDISVVLGISENKYLDISIQTGSENFKNIVLKETTSLKKALNEQGLIVNSFFLSTKSNKNLYQEPNNIDLGYSVKA